MKALKIISGTLLLLWALLLGGCQTTITNLTQQRIPENPSSIYTFSFSAKLAQSNIDRDTLKGTIVINGQKYQMMKSPLGQYAFEYDYQMPQGRSEVGYYFILEYDYFIDNARYHKERFSEVYKALLVNRYVIQLESVRAPVGATIAVVGRGFSPHDVILFGNVEVPTLYASQNALSFKVPSLPANQNYDVLLRTGQGDIPVSSFRIDRASLNAYVENSSLASGERTIMIFTIGYEAPPGGLYVDVTTNIPESIIMPEVIIPEGASSISIPIEGGQPGSGTIYVEVPGFDTVEVPISVY